MRHLYPPLPGRSECLDVGRFGLNCTLIPQRVRVPHSAASIAGLASTGTLVLGSHTDAEYPSPRYRTGTEKQRPRHGVQRMFALTAAYRLADLKRPARVPVMPTRPIELAPGKATINIPRGRALQTNWREMSDANRLAAFLENGAKRGNVCLDRRECCRTKPNMRLRRCSS